MKFEEHYTEFELLYDLSKSSYVPRTSWTTEKEFTVSYPTVKKEFTLVKLEKVERLPV
jgi:hypothetical protein